ncbi:gamma-glutamyltransferase [Variovorax terrae]|uniref:Gamma-glutamyltransferase family protein n=1 Tax=Variovorax terrae TaxID=2923278 RepID=A0A9X2AQQ8_9BURK|nr:gamma-glutamyltransferase [Variovorax terrae]MCJ0764797.1 gamma-glutamyltransferase family protein [Variovorax terrae]
MSKLRLEIGEKHQHWVLSKQVTTSRTGVVVAASARAAEIGAAVLAQGGNAVDAAVAAACALHVVEPWSSGLGGGGCMLVHQARENRYHAIDFSMKAALDADPRNYPLAPGNARIGTFRWPRVEGGRNMSGPTAMLIPGAVDGLGQALERFGTWDWHRALAPAVDLAERGWPVNWYTTLAIGTEARGLARFPGTRDVFLRDGHYAPTVEEADGVDVIRNPRDAAMLRRLAERGYRDFYEGETARDLLADVAACGRTWTAAELAAYRARIAEPMALDHAGVRLLAVPGLNGGPTALRFFERYLRGHAPAPSQPTPDDYGHIASVMRDCWTERYASLGDTGPRDKCTTHLNVVDAEGNMVSLTNTLGARFGSRVMLERLGLLMNNGMFWFDPEPGRPNSIGLGKWPLTNACPMMVERAGQPWLALGGSGGRHIPPAVIQLLSFMLHHGLDLAQAFHTPRIDASDPAQVLCDHRLPPEVVARIAERHRVSLIEHAAYPMPFAVPSAVQRVGDLNSGMASIDVPYSVAVSEEDLAHPHPAATREGNKP